MSFLLTPVRRATPAITSTPSRLFSSTRPSQLARMTLVGRLGTDPELSETGRGSAMIKYSVGSSYGPKDNRQTSWFKVAVFPAEGSALKDYVMGLTKGTLVYLEGDATMKTYEDAEGRKQSSLNIVQTKLDVLKRPQSEGLDQSS